MSTPHSQDVGPFEVEFFGVPPPENAHLPIANELLDVCAVNKPRGSITLPSESPVFWIKYGYAVYWNEVVAQDMAYRELRRMGSPVRAPAVFYACRHNYRVYIVMEYIPGSTVRECLERATGQWEKEHIMRQVVLSLSELHRIPIAPGSSPAAVNGGYIRHTCFYDQEAFRHYENVDQLETHLNEFLNGTRQRSLRIKNLSLEPMVFCQSDVYPDNFMINEAGDIVVIDFADVSILPSSFARYQLYDNRLGFDIRERVYVPNTEGVDNTQALLIVGGQMSMGWHFLAVTGQRMPGGGKDAQLKIDNSVVGCRRRPRLT